MTVELIDNFTHILQGEVITFGVEGVLEELTFDHIVGWQQLSPEERGAPFASPRNDRS